MSAIEHGLTSSSQILVQDRTYSVDRVGMVSMREILLTREENLTTIFPSTFAQSTRVAGVYFQEGSAEIIPGGLAKVTLLYEGWNSGGINIGGGGSPEDNAPIYELSNSATLIPIEQHPSMGTWVASERTAGRDPAPGNVFTGFKFGAVSGGSRSLFGVSSYYGPAPVWTKEWLVSSQPSNTNDVGEIDTPDGNPPSLAGTNWLVVENSYRQIAATLWRRRKVWKRSPVNSWGGWNTDIY
jgi:hypothetical protein